MSANWTSWIRTLIGKRCWWVPACFQKQLLGPTGLRLEEWVQSGAARVIKKGPHRIVYHVQLPGLSFYLKHNLLPDIRTWLRQLVRPSKARIELERARAVAERGIPTVEPLALGEPSSFLGVGESYFLTHDLLGTEPLQCFLGRAIHERTPRDIIRLRKNLAEQLGQMMGRAHQTGIVHNDLHVGNILVRPEGTTDCRLFLIDLNAVNTRAAIRWEKACDNLAMLNRWFQFRSSRADRFRFWNAYVRTRTGLGWRLQGKSKAVLAREVEQRTRTSFYEMSRHYDVRCLNNNRHFQRLLVPHAWARAVTDIDPRDLDSFLKDPEAIFRDPKAKVLKKSPESMVVEMELVVGGQTKRVIAKKFAAFRWSHTLAGWFRRSQALRSWIFGHALVGRTLPTPRPLVIVQKRRLGLWGHAYLITEKVENAQTLSSCLAELQDLPSPCARREIRKRIDQVARALRELHACDYSNRDTKASNWLIGPAPAPTEDRNFGGVWIIDLVGLSQVRNLSPTRKVQNIARLNASFLSNPGLTRTDRLRFLRTYLRWNLVGKEGWKDWWRDIDRATQGKVAQNRRRKRELT